MAKQVLTDHKEGMTQLAELLLEREVVFTEDVERIFGKRKKDILREQREAEQKAASDESGSAQSVAPQTEESEVLSSSAQ
jgi:cell division protease FtsH